MDPRRLDVDWIAEQNEDVYYIFSTEIEPVSPRLM